MVVQTGFLFTMKDARSARRQKTQCQKVLIVYIWKTAVFKIYLEENLYVKHGVRTEVPTIPHQIMPDTFMQKPRGLYDWSV